MIPPLVKGQVVSDKNEIAGLIDDYDWKRYYGLSLSKIERSNTACVAFKCTSTQDCKHLRIPNANAFALLMSVQ